MLKIKRNLDGVDIRIVGIIDDQGVIFSSSHIQTHGYRLQLHHPLRNIRGGYMQIERHCQTTDGIFDGSLIGKRNHDGIFKIEKRIADGGAAFHFFDAGDKQVCIAIFSGP
ncbi:hypothetical protein SDC9_197300 [bioreactor metagenome]|uniref:Uncharacterized protein n=1 Tax=bioreactor metagenome TaxID=1076179 RepID=A0A645IED0_9ZZZZ